MALPPDTMHFGSRFYPRPLRAQHVAIRLTLNEAHHLRVLAWKHRRSLSHLIRVLLRDAILRGTYEIDP